MLDVGGGVSWPPGSGAAGSEPLLRGHGALLGMAGKSHLRSY